MNQGVQHSRIQRQQRSQPSQSLQQPSRHLMDSTFYFQHVITARKRSLRRLCFHRCLSVHRGMSAHCMLGCIHPLGRHSPRQTPPQADTPQADTPACPVHAGIHPLPSACLDTHPCPVHAGIHPPCSVYEEIHDPLHSAFWDIVNKWAVCIPLECILVSEIGLIFMWKQS